MHFRRQVATQSNPKWATIDAALWTMYLVQLDWVSIGGNLLTGVSTTEAAMQKFTIYQMAARLRIPSEAHPISRIRSVLFLPCCRLSWEGSFLLPVGPVDVGFSVALVAISNPQPVSDFLQTETQLGRVVGLLPDNPLVHSSRFGVIPKQGQLGK